MEPFLILADFLVWIVGFCSLGIALSALFYGKFKYVLLGAVVSLLCYLLLLPIEHALR